MGKTLNCFRFHFTLTGRKDPTAGLSFQTQQNDKKYWQTSVSEKENLSKHKISQWQMKRPVYSHKCLALKFFSIFSLPFRWVSFSFRSLFRLLACLVVFYSFFSSSFAAAGLFGGGTTACPDRDSRRRFGMSYLKTEQEQIEKLCIRK